MSTTEIVDFKLFPWKRNSLYSSAPILFRLGTNMQKNIASWNIIHIYVSINLWNPLSMPVEKETRTQTRVLSRKQRNCLPTAPTAVNLWIVVTALPRRFWAVRKQVDIITIFFKRLDHINDQLYEVEMAEAEIEQRQPIIVGFLLLQYA